MKKTKITLIFTLTALLLCLSISAADFEKSRIYQNNFSDVPETSWYAQSVSSVYEIELMEGVSENEFDVDSEMSVAQAITIAARLHSIYNDTEIPDVDGGRWFQKYVDYCLKNKIMKNGQFNSYTRSVLSYEMVELFAAALPNEFYPAINKISAICDVPIALDFADDILLFYNAGILNGNDADGTFLPMSAITRKRASVILSRTALSENRLKFTLPEPKQEYTSQEILKLIDKQTVKDTLDGIVLASYEGHKVTAAEYRYYSFISDGDNKKTENEIKFAIAAEMCIKEANLKVSREDYEDLLISYYSPRTSDYGDTSYFDALDNVRLTDSAFAKLIALNKLNYLALAEECSNISYDDVYKYALENDYICASHILIAGDSDNASRKALEIYISLSNGEDFDKLLKEYGQDPGLHGRNGGYIFTRGWMVKGFEDAAYETKEGEISNIVETEYGYHIIKRLPFNKQVLVSSPDYVSVAINAGTEKFNVKVAEKQSKVKLKYIENFDGLSEILK